MNIYVGNFSYELIEEDLKEIFAAYGRVESVKIISDKFSGKSRGFAFVEMLDKIEAQTAMQGITEIKGRKVTINEAKPQTSRSPYQGRKGNLRNKDFRGAKRY